MFKVPSDEMETVIPQIKNIMETTVALPVKLVTEMGEGKTWYEVK